MSGTKSKNKGSTFERDISKLLNELYDTPKGFARSSGSGNRFGGKNKVNLNIHNRQASKAMLGDIQTPDSVDLLVECKAYKDLAFHQIVQGKCKLLNAWLDQVMTDRSTFYEVFKELLPIMLIFKINNKGVFIVIPKKLIKVSCRRITKVEYSYKDELFCIMSHKEFITNEELVKEFKRRTVV
jgi:hypothetical protein